MGREDIASRKEPLGYGEPPVGKEDYDEAEAADIHAWYGYGLGVAHKEIEDD